MPQAFPDPVGGFTQGFLGGAQLGLQIQERKAKVKARLGEIQKEKQEQAIQQLETGAKFIKIPGFEAQGRALVNKASIAMGGQGLSPEELSNVGNRLDETIGRVGKLITEFRSPKSPISGDIPKLMQGLGVLRTEAITALDPEQAKFVGEEIERQVKPAVEATEREQLTQATALGRLAPEAAGIPQGEIIAAQEEALARAGVGGAKILAERISAEAGGRKAPSAILGEFEVVSPEFGPETRGTPAYQEAFEQHIGMRFGTTRVLGATAKGTIKVINTRTGEITEKDAAGDLLPNQLRILPTETLKSITVFDSLSDVLNTVSEKFKADPTLVGPINARVRGFQAKFFGDKNFARFSKEVKSQIEIAYALSGKQISVQELKMLEEAILPVITQPGQSFEGALEFAQNWVATRKNQTLNALEASRYYVSPDLRSGTGRGEGLPPTVPEGTSKFKIISVE